MYYVISEKPDYSPPRNCFQVVLEAMSGDADTFEDVVFYQSETAGPDEMELTAAIDTARRFIEWGNVGGKFPTEEEVPGISSYLNKDSWPSDVFSDGYYAAAPRYLEIFWFDNLGNRFPVKEEKECVSCCSCSR